MDTILQLNEFFVEGKDPNKSHVLLNITEPSTEEENKKGYFFAVYEIDNGDNRYIMKVQDIVDEVENQYYESKNASNAETLEEVLNQINKKTTILINDGADLNVVIGAVIDNQIIFSFFGQPQIILFYQTKQGDYKKMDLAAQNSNQENGEAESAPIIFSQIVEGKISERDYLYVGTKRINDYFSQDRLQKIICSRPPRQSSQHLQRVLSELKNGYSFGGIMTHLQKKLVEPDKPQAKKPDKGSSARSLRGLFNTHTNTAKILSPSLLPRLQNKDDDVQTETETIATPVVHERTAQINATHLHSRPTGLPHLRERPIKNNVDWRQVVALIINYTWVAFKYLGRFIFWLLFVILAGLKQIGFWLVELFLLATNIRNQRLEILNKWKSNINTCRINLRRLPRLTKILIIAGIILSVIISSTIYYLRIKQNRQVALVNFNQTIQQIKSKRDTAESYLIFDENTKAGAELNNAMTLLSGLKCSEFNQTDICQKTKSDLDNLMNKIRKIYNTPATKLADLGVGQADSKLTLTNKNIFNYNSHKNQISFYGLLTKNKGVKDTVSNITGFKTASTPKEDDYSVFIDNNNQVINYDPKTDSWKQREINYPNPANNITAACVYNRRLYLVDSANNQIYRHDPTANGWGKGTVWLTDNSGIDFKNNTAIAIDGDVFTLNKNGKIYKFNAGKLQDYSIANLDPKLESADDLWTYYEMKYLYILDGKNKRLIIVDKDTGKLKKQLTSDNFVNPTSMVIDEPNGTAYIYDSGKLYQIDIGL